MPEARPAKTKPGFVHLHAHTHYSLLDGLGKVPDVISRVKELGMDSVAITDHGVLYGAIDFYETAIEAGVKPIIGCEVYVARGSRKSRGERSDGKPYHLILLAKNQTGYQNLLKLVTAAHLEGYYYKPRVDWELLQQHSEGLICTSACLQGEVAQHILDGDDTGARKVAERYAKQFGPGHYYLELQHHPSIPEQGKVNEVVKRIAKDTDIPLVATNDSHYVLPEDAEAQDALLCIQTGKLMSEPDRMNMTGEDFSLKSPEQMAEAFADTPEAVANTVKIAEMVDLKIELGGMILPKFDVPDSTTEREYLRKLVKEGIERRYGKTFSAEIKDRVSYEMEVIERMGFESYFLIVQDFVNWAKDNGIVVGPGRGSGAGSIVAYALRITNLDPIEFGLLFERFLNPDRISMPDFDLDFADDRRGEVIDYVSRKYGQDHVAQIITFGTLGAKAAVRDTGRVLGVPYGEVDAVCKLIPGRPGTKLQDVRTQSDIREVEQNAGMKKLLDLAQRLEGSNRHASTHAAGVVIGDKPLVNYVPLQHATRGDTSVVTQYSMWPIEKIGLLKMDFLGLSNLTILRNAVEIIEAVHGVDIDVDALSLDDEATYGLLSRGQTYGVFQLESDGMRRYIKELKPNRFEDIVAMVSLYRPGPMQFIDSFIRRKHGKEEIEYQHPDLKNALEETYGVLVYQEQIMQISKDLAGFTGGEADTLRKAVGKKIKALMDKMRPQFVEGMVGNGYERKLGEELFDLFEAFAQYGFNKAHAACYALIAYQTAYLKAHYPSAFMAALMTAEQENLDKLTQAITECEQLGIPVLPPDVNESFANFAVASDKRAIRFGLSAIKNVGRNTVDAIIQTRKSDGPFKDLNGFLGRLPDGAANKKSMESLIKAGALDSLEDRARLLAGLEAICRFAQTKAAEARSGQSSLFGDGDTESVGLELPPAGELDQRQKLEWERELLGMYVSEHPLTHYQHLLQDFPALTSLGNEPDGKAVTIACLLTVSKNITTRKGDPMAFATVEDRHSQSEVIVFPKLYAEKRELLTPGALLKIAGKVSRKDGDVKLIADRIAPLTEGPVERSVAATSESPEDIDIEPVSPEPPTPSAPPAPPATAEPAAAADSLTIELHGDTTLAMLEEVKDILSEHRGESPVYLLLEHAGQRKKLRLPHRVRFSEGLVRELTTGRPVSVTTS